MEIAGIKTFGIAPQKLDSFSRFNLFIGENGSGKTTALHLLAGVDVEFGDPLGTRRRRSTARPSAGSRAESDLQMYSALLPSELLNDKLPYRRGDLTIEFEAEPKARANKPPIRFVDSANVEGDPIEVRRLCHLVERPLTSSEFHRLLLERGSPESLAILNFGLDFVFERRMAVMSEGTVIELFTRDDDGQTPFSSAGGFRPRRWASGVFQSAALLLDVLAGGSRVLLLDEPEIHLEPKRCRRLIRVIMWLIARSSHRVLSPEMSILVAQFDGLWAAWCADRSDLYWGEDADFDPPSAVVNSPSQLFVASHSATLIREFLALGSDATVFDFALDWEKFSFNPNEPGTLGSHSGKEAEAGVARRTVLSSVVRPVSTEVGALLDNLGCQASDLLQANGIVWVEGPSDVVYLSRWIRMWCQERGRREPVQGLDYEFSMYGGAILANLCATSAGLTDDERSSKLVEMFSFSRNAYVVLDSDAFLNEETGAVVDRSNFREAKRLVANQLLEAGGNTGVWFDEGNTEIATIEDYLDVASRAASGLSGGKKLRALKAVDSWDENKLLAHFEHDLERRVGDLVEAIVTWSDNAV